MWATPKLESLFLNSTYTIPTLMSARSYVQLMFISSTYRITGLHHNNWCPTLSAAYVCKLYVQNYRAKLHLWVSNLKCEI